jgi:hypothetical protein
MGPHRNSTYAPQWLNWPKRCERALRRHFIAQVGESFPLDLARARNRTDGRAWNTRRQVLCQARRFGGRLLHLEKQGA